MALVFMTHMDNVTIHAVLRKENLLPIALAEGSVMKRDVPRDHPITFDDVEVDTTTLVYQLFKEQVEMFFPEYAEKQLRHKKALSLDTSRVNFRIKKSQMRVVAYTKYKLQADQKIFFSETNS